MSCVFQTVDVHVTTMAHWKLPEIHLGPRPWSFAQHFPASSHSTVSSLSWRHFYDFYLVSLAIFLSVSCFWSDFCFGVGNSLPCWCLWMLMIQCWISPGARCSRQHQSIRWQTTQFMGLRSDFSSFGNKKAPLFAAFVWNISNPCLVYCHYCMFELNKDQRGGKKNRSTFKTIQTWINMAMLSCKR